MAVVSVLAAAAIRYALDPVLEDRARYMLQIMAVLLSALYGGLGPGAVALSLGAIVTSLSPIGLGHPLASLGDFLNLGLYLACGLGVLAVTEFEWRERGRREEAEAELARVNAELEATVAARTTQLQEAVSELESFCHSMAHDLRTPTRAIAGNARILLEDHGDELDENLNEKLRRINAAALKLASLVDALLIYARLGTQDLQLSTVDLGTLTRETVNELTKKAESPIELTLGPDLKVEGDDRQLAVLLKGIVANSLLYRKPGEPARLEVVREGNEIAFRDQGIGFDMTYAHKVFLPFERLHRDEAYPGVGMGLANVARIAQRHGGSARVESTPGEGTTVWVRLGS